MRQTLVADRAMDAVLDGSFPASDPPSWAPTLFRPAPLRRPDTRRIRTVRPHAWVGHVTSIAGAISIALMTPLFVVALPIALAWRVVLALTVWRRALSDQTESARSPPPLIVDGENTNRPVQWVRQREASRCSPGRAPAPL